MVKVRPAKNDVNNGCMPFGHSNNRLAKHEKAFPRVHVSLPLCTAHVLVNVLNELVQAACPGVREHEL